MKNQWLKKSVDLTLLTERLRSFFNETDFKTTIEELQEGSLIQAVSQIPNLSLRTSVKIIGRPDDFSVEFSAGSERYSSLSMIVGYVTVMFGGGFLISREAKRREALDKLENAFWRYTQKGVADLVDSATDAKSHSPIH